MSSAVSPVPTYFPKTVGSPTEIRPFAVAKIDKAMRDVLSNLPKNKRGALVVYADTESKELKGAIYGRRPGRFFGLLPPGEWSYVVTGAVNMKGQLAGSAALGYSW